MYLLCPDALSHGFGICQGMKKLTLTLSPFKFTSLIWSSWTPKSSYTLSSLPLANAVHGSESILETSSRDLPETGLETTLICFYRVSTGSR